MRFRTALIRFRNRGLALCSLAGRRDHQVQSRPKVNISTLLRGCSKPVNEALLDFDMLNNVSFQPSSYTRSIIGTRESNM